MLLCANKWTSKLAANGPFMLYNCTPLSFLDVDIHDYANAMMGVYERLDVSMAVDIFVWNYRRSLSKYVVVLESLGAPDPVRLRYREFLNEVIQLGVRERKSIDTAFSMLNLSDESAPEFRDLLVACVIVTAICYELRPVPLGRSIRDGLLS